MRTLPILLVGALLATPLSAQALNEDFSGSTFPPTGWSIAYLPAHSSGIQWSDVAVTPLNSAVGLTFPTTQAAAHSYDVGGIVSDDRLETPDMDLSAYSAPRLTYDGCLGWSGFMVHTGGAVIGSSYIEVSTDGGATYAVAWQEASAADYYTMGIVEDLTALAANQSQVRIAFHYEGDYAHEWGVDNVIVDNAGPVGPSVSLGGTCPGPMSVNASGMTVGGPVAFAYGTPGSFTAPGGPCAGLTVGINSPTILAVISADGGGNATLAGNAPSNGCGNIAVIAVDVATCVSSNVAGL